MLIAQLTVDLGAENIGLPSNQLFTQLKTKQEREEETLAKIVILVRVENTLVEYCFYFYISFKYIAALCFIVNSWIVSILLIWHEI